MIKALLAASALAVCMSGAASAQDAAAGEKVFAKCKACHVIDATTNRVGPSLHGIIGRTAGTVEGFKYSEAMAEAGKGGLVWDNANLDKYLTDPKAMMPGTKMIFAGIKGEREANDLWAFISQYDKDGKTK